MPAFIEPGNKRHRRMQQSLRQAGQPFEPPLRGGLKQLRLAGSGVRSVHPGRSGLPFPSLRAPLWPSATEVVDSFVRSSIHRPALGFAARIATTGSCLDDCVQFFACTAAEIHRWLHHAFSFRDGIPYFVRNLPSACGTQLRDTSFVPEGAWTMSASISDGSINAADVNWDCRLSLFCGLRGFRRLAGSLAAERREEADLGRCCRMCGGLSRGR